MFARLPVSSARHAFKPSVRSRILQNRGYASTGGSTGKEAGNMLPTWALPIGALTFFGGLYMIFSGPSRQTVGSLDHMAKHKAESGKHESPKGVNDDSLKSSGKN
ncbi:hypothetical protein SISSUDRAFT_267974 [Sistotremastrum suecicum HHB10207 ss-3]|uniref:Uncharacterized protein n=1 Tax=Sistotremastrum suecicum HHB10207 ss-3 TaxID=1314776 RepID=A0A165ZS41_9AGAM|nr:hypothetical protein SISSUDRAFT_267974 [Sistotremastrum suecicum HHB10207 ss-3]